MLYRIEFRPAAVRDLAKLDNPAREKIAAKIDALQQDPRPPGTEVLQGHQKRYRLRVGVYRIIYEVKDNMLLVLVIRIGHRREIYRFLK
jgi:mRNA interferase RelE/StbE